MSGNTRTSGIRIFTISWLCKNVRVNLGSYHVNSTKNIWIHNAFYKAVSMPWALQKKFVKGFYHILHVSRTGHKNTIPYAFVEPTSKGTCYNRLIPLEEVTEVIEIWVNKVKEQPWPAVLKISSCTYLATCTFFYTKAFYDFQEIWRHSSFSYTCKSNRQ